MLTYSLMQRTTQPLYVFFYECIKRDILSGVLVADEKLPSKRALARHHQVSLVTIEAAYRQLIAEGYVRAEERKGYYVNALSPLMLSSLKEAGLGNTEFEDSKSYEVSDNELTHQVSYQQFPYALWAKNIRKTLTEEPVENVFEQSDARGVRRLRRALAHYLEGTRGMRVDPECIVIGAGAQILYLMVIQLLGMGNRIALENPGYTKLARIYQSLGIATDPIVADGNGMIIDDLTTSQATVAHVMPSHQYPTGSVMSIARRYELLGWATQKPYRYIIEDDYDAELRFSGQPIPTLSSIDVSEKVIYINTFAKTLGSAFRIGYMVLPIHLMKLFQSKLGFYSCSVSTLDQLSLARFIESGEYERHNNRLKVYYKTIAHLLSEVIERFDATGKACLSQVSAGTHCLLRVPKDLAARGLYCDLFQVLEHVQVLHMPLAAFCMDTSQGSQMLINQVIGEDQDVYVLDYAHAESNMLQELLYTPSE